MIKTVKVKKQMRLDELIKYVWDNNEIFKGRTHIKFISNSRCTVIFDNSGYFETNYGHDVDDTFTVELEEEITEDAVFEDITVVCKINSRDETGHFYNSTLKDIKKAENLLSAYIPINGKLELVWEAK